MENSDIFLNLFYDIHKNSFKIKTDLKKDKVDEILFECYRATLNQSPDYRAPKMHDVYNILIKLDLSQDIFPMLGRRHDQKNGLNSFFLARADLLSQSQPFSIHSKEISVSPQEQN